MVDKDRLQNEKELIYLLLHYKDAIDNFLSCGLSDKNFQEEHRVIIYYIVESYEIDKVLLTRKSFENKLQKYKVPNDRIAYKLAFSLCYSARASINDFPLLVKKIIENKIKDFINNELRTFKTNISSTGYINAVKILADKCDDILNDINSNSQEEVYYKPILELSRERVKNIEDIISGKIKEEPLVLSGIREIDYTMVTGFEEGTLTLICADVASYKSCLMLNIGLNVWKGGYNVLFVPLEMPRNQMWIRACARESKVRAELITRNIKNLSSKNLEKIKKMNEEWEKRSSKFYMMENIGNTTVPAIQRQIEKNINIIKPKLVVIDYIANLEAHKNRFGRNDLEIGDMLKCLRRNGKDLGFAVLSAAQLGREALKRIRKIGSNKDKSSINSEDIRGSHEYSADADNIFALVKNSAQPNELLDIYCVKSRNGPTVFKDNSVKATLDVRPEYGLIHSSVLYDDEGEGEDSGAENEEYDDDFEKLMVKIDKDANEMFEEKNDMYEYNSFSDKEIDDNSDIENVIDD
jgi:hypothetical protein